MKFTGTHISYLDTSHRKRWLFTHGIQKEHTAGSVLVGKEISEVTYLNRLRIGDLLWIY